MHREKLPSSRHYPGYWALGRNCAEWLITDPIAHRGLYDLARAIPENSLAAFEAACAADVPIELDVQISRDRLPVVIHDRDLLRVAGADARVGALSARELQEVKLFGTPEHVPLLEEVLDLVAGRVPLLIELKHPSQPTDMAHRMARSVASYPGQLAFQSFHPWPLYELRRLVSAHPIGQIAGHLPNAPRALALLTRAMVTNVVTRPDFISYELSALPNRVLEFWRRRGAAVIVWPVTSADEVAEALAVADNYLFHGMDPP